MSIWGIVAAAGRGARAGLDRNKVYYRYMGRSVLSRCLDALAASAAFDGLVLVISKQDEAEYRALCESEGRCPLVKSVVYGGNTRRESVYRGLLAVPEDAEIVAIHDGARPFVTREIIQATIDSARKWGSGVISTPVVDTIKTLTPDGGISTLDRSQLRAVQTPQTFNYRLLMDAYARAQAENLSVTDDAMLLEHYFGSIHLVSVDGAEENIKLTTRSDFETLKEKETAQAMVRIGQGYDAHRLVKGRKLILCGVDVPHETGLDGHSDADVALHALMDALLGALALGDIGRHFPDSDAKYKGISSMILLKEVVEMVRAKGFEVGNVDVTIVAQRPKLAPYINEMRRNVAGALGVDVDRVNVKATTTERMGFEGEETGISAQAAALLTRRLG